MPVGVLCTNKPLYAPRAHDASFHVHLRAVVADIHSSASAYAVQGSVEHTGWASLASSTTYKIVLAYSSFLIPFFQAASSWNPASQISQSCYQSIYIKEEEAVGELVQPVLVRVITSNNWQQITTRLLSNPDPASLFVRRSKSKRVVCFAPAFSNSRCLLG